MKRILVTIIFATTALISLQAQNYFYRRPVRLGFKVDPVFFNSLKPFDSGVEKGGSNFGINYGLMADIGFRDTRGAFATGLEVVHAPAMIKYTNSDNINNAPGEYRIKLQYLQIPLSVKLKTNDFYGLRWWGQFGTYMGALLSSRADFSGSTPTKNVNILNATNKVNMGMLIGAGAEYRLADRTDLFFGLGFENGFTDITSNGKWHDGRVVLNRWAIRLGVFF